MLTVMIPTKGRPDKLRVCVKSIPIHVAVFIVATQESDIPDGLFNDNRVQSMIKINASMSVPQAFNYMASMAIGDIVMSSDDVEYEVGAFDVLEDMLNKVGHDVVIGMHVTNMKCNDDAFQCIGHEFKDKHQPLYHEGYKHFYIDTEVGDLARSLGKFMYCPESKLKNFHPACGCPADATHSHMRNEKLAHDQELYARRKHAWITLPQEEL